MQAVAEVEAQMIANVEAKAAGADADLQRCVLSHVHQCYAGRVQACDQTDSF